MMIAALCSLRVKGVSNILCFETIAAPLALSPTEEQLGSDSLMLPLFCLSFLIGVEYQQTDCY